MINSKQRSFLRTMANALKPLMQLGKEGLTEEFIQQYNEMIESREIIKINVLENSGEAAKDIAQALAEKTGSEIVQVIGHKIVMYRASATDPKIDLVRLVVREEKAKEVLSKKESRMKSAEYVKMASRMKTGLKSAPKPGSRTKAVGRPPAAKGRSGNR